MTPVAHAFWTELEKIASWKHRLAEVLVGAPLGAGAGLAYSRTGAGKRKFDAGDALAAGTGAAVGAAGSASQSARLRAVRTGSQHATWQQAGGGKALREAAEHELPRFDDMLAENLGRTKEQQQAALAEFRQRIQRLKSDLSFMRGVMAPRERAARIAALEHGYDSTQAAALRSTLRPGDVAVAERRGLLSKHEQGLADLLQREKDVAGETSQARSALKKQIEAASEAEGARIQQTLASKFLGLL